MTTQKTPGQAAYEARQVAKGRRMGADEGTPDGEILAVIALGWNELPAGMQADEEAGAQAAIATQPDFTEHPACDAHRWWAVVKHCGSFAYGFAATSDGLRIYDDASEFEYAKARGFE